MIEDVSAVIPQKGSFTDLSGGVTTAQVSSHDKALIVYQNVDECCGDSITNQLLSKARMVLPAVMNYLFFSTAQVAVVYFGKTLLKDGTKRGEKEGMEDFKIRMIRYLTSEIWPPILRTDAPDESLGTDKVGSGGKTLSPNSAEEKMDEEARQLAKERSWFKKSIESNMQVLLYLKNGVEDTKYLKVILTNTQQRLHFDVIDPKEEKYRWDLRMLFTRIMDNLETQKAIDSYESYEKLFQWACDVAAKYAVELERPLQSMAKVTFRDSFMTISNSASLNSVGNDALYDAILQNSNVFDSSTAKSPPVEEGSPPKPASLKITTALSEDYKWEEVSEEEGGNAHVYRWMECLDKPESATLDYKSYFSHTSTEIKHRCVKFMCGFLNAYREGKLVIGVHEMPKRDPDGTVSEGKEGKTITQHNDLVNQFVVGVRVTPTEMADVQEDVSAQLLECIPPIPPQTVHFDVYPVVFPSNLAYSKEMLILYDLSSTLSRDSLKQKSNYAIRVLAPMGLSLIPLDMVDLELEDWVLDDLSDDADRVEDYNPTFLKAEVYVIAAISDPETLTREKWMEELSRQLQGPRGRCRYFFKDYPEHVKGPLTLPKLSVVEIAVNIDWCGFDPLKNYQGKFFTGWPSIPIWDTTTKTIRRVERNYNVFKGSRQYHERILHRNECVSDDSPALLSSGKANGRSASNFQRYMVASNWTWYSNPQVVNRVLSYLYDQNRISQILNFRLIHPVCNEVFENKQGIYLIHMLSSTPFGVPVFNIDCSHVSRMQYAFLHSGVPPLPLLLCRVYELIGTLPSPYPYVIVPLVQQSFRIASFLVPLFYRQHYFDGQMRQAVVLDLRDSYLKTIAVKDGNLVLETIVTMGFEPLNRRQLTELVARDSNDLYYSTHMTEIANKSVFELPHSEFLALKQSFIARRSAVARSSSITFANDASLRDSRGVSNILSPKISDSTLRQTPRVVEPNIPLIHFKFLSHSDVQNRRLYTNDDTFPFSNTVSGDTRWTLQHLLSWYNALLTDESHYRFFGYCNRSIAFHVSSLSEICAEDAEKNALECLLQPSHGLPESKVGEAGEDKHNCPAARMTTRENCILHKKVRDWLDVY